MSPHVILSDFAGPCSSNPCLNGGVCTDLNQNGFTCDCQLGWLGTTCSLPGMYVGVARVILLFVNSVQFQVGNNIMV